MLLEQPIKQTIINNKQNTTKKSGQTAMLGNKKLKDF
jgi:hypothetical protein